MQPTRMTGSETNLIQKLPFEPRHSYSVLLPVGFTVPGLLPEPAVSSYLTFSPLPSDHINELTKLQAVRFLWHFP